MSKVWAGQGQKGHAGSGGGVWGRASGRSEMEVKVPPAKTRLEACRHIFGQAPIERGSAVKIFAVFAFLGGKSFRRFFGGGQKRR